ncbi:MAG: hypothetical protein DCF23_07015 [Cyanobium sp.]|nr:MAG: hypothetical protein DCF23_07015 [Cyanobium sp.]
MARPGDEVAAGDGLGAFGVAFILPVQAHYESSNLAVLQSIWGGVSDLSPPQMSKKKEQRIEPRMTTGHAAA